MLGEAMQATNLPTVLLRSLYTQVLRRRNVSWANFLLKKKKLLRRKPYSVPGFHPRPLSLTTFLRKSIDIE